MARIQAFLCLGCAAFAWVPPGIDREGLAALGFAFLAWSVGRGFRLPFTFAPRPAGPAALEHPERIQPVPATLMEQLARDAQAELADYDGR